MQRVDPAGHVGIQKILLGEGWYGNMPSYIARYGPSASSTGIQVLSLWMLRQNGESALLALVNPWTNFRLSVHMH